MNQLRAATSFLILHHPFIAVPLLRLQLVPDPSRETAATDGRQISYNEDFVSSLTLEQTVFLLAHETLHVALAHHLRRGDRRPKAWNAAADFVINLLLKDAGFALAPGALCSPVFLGWSTEQVYRQIFKQAQEGLCEAKARGTSGTLDDFIPQGQGGLVEDMKAINGKQLSQAQASQEEYKLNVTLKHALRLDAMLRGTDSLAQAFSRAVQPRSPSFDARSELAALLSVAVGRDDYSWLRPNPRYLTTGIYLPALAKAEFLVDGVVAIDTSCSITPRLLSFMAGACDDILAAYPQSVLQVVYSDSEVRSTEEISSYDSPITLARAEGGGGTRFSPVFDWVTERCLQPTFLLYMTDLEGPAPEDPGYPVVWIAIDASVAAPPFGKVIHLSTVDFD